MLAIFRNAFIGSRPYILVGCIVIVISDTGLARELKTKLRLFPWTNSSIPPGIIYPFFKKLKK